MCSVYLEHFAAHLQLILQRNPLPIASTCLLGTLITCILDYEYRARQRDICYWRDAVISVLDVPSMDPMSLLSLSLLFKVFFSAVVLLVHLFPSCLLRTYAEHRNRRLYASFILRRLMLQLEMAMLRMPRRLELNDPLAHRSYEQAKEQAYHAVDLFRRDAAKLLVHLGQPHDEAFFVLDEEEQALKRAGYGHIRLRVTEQLLAKLVYPQRK